MANLSGSVLSNIPGYKVDLLREVTEALTQMNNQ